MYKVLLYKFRRHLCKGSMYNPLLLKYRENIPTTCRMEYRKLVHTFRRKTNRNTSSFQQQDKHRILLSLATSSAGFA